MIFCFCYFRCSDAGEREPIESSDAVYIETANHDDIDYQHDSDLFCPASPTTVPASAIKSRSNSGLYLTINNKNKSNFTDQRIS